MPRQNDRKHHNRSFLQAHQDFKHEGITANVLEITGGGNLIVESDSDKSTGLFALGDGSIVLNTTGTIDISVGCASVDVGDTFRVKNNTNLVMETKTDTYCVYTDKFIVSDNAKVTTDTSNNSDFCAMIFAKEILLEGKAKLSISNTNYAIATMKLYAQNDSMIEVDNCVYGIIPSYDFSIIQEMVISDNAKIDINVSELGIATSGNIYVEDSGCLTVHSQGKAVFNRDDDCRIILDGIEGSRVEFTAGNEGDLMVAAFIDDGNNFSYNAFEIEKVKENIK